MLNRHPYAASVMQQIRILACAPRLILCRLTAGSVQRFDWLYMLVACRMSCACSKHCRLTLIRGNSTESVKFDCKCSPTQSLAWRNNCAAIVSRMCECSVGVQGSPGDTLLADIMSTMPDAAF